MPIEDWEPELMSDELTGFTGGGPYFRGAWDYAFHQDPKLGEALLKRIEGLVSSLEGLAPRESERLHTLLQKLPSLWRWTVDWYYSKQSVENIPRLAKRFLKLTPVVAGGRTPSSDVNVYLREASKCYLHGLASASVALARSALEAALSEVLPNLAPGTMAMDLRDKIRGARRFRFISANAESDAESIRIVANRALHNRPCTQDEALSIIKKVRNVLLELYRSQGNRAN